MKTMAITIVVAILFLGLVWLAVEVLVARITRD